MLPNGYLIRPVSVMRPMPGSRLQPLTPFYQRFSISRLFPVGFHHLDIEAQTDSERPWVPLSHYPRLFAVHASSGLSSYFSIVANSSFVSLVKSVL